jgi:sporulation protein YlmC with PRC-barrel domain
MDKTEKEDASKSEKDKKALTKARLIDMQIIDSDGNIVGKVTDIAFTVGKMGMSLIVETKKGEITEIAWESIQAAGDFVVLKPPGGPAQSAAGQTGTEQQPQVLQSQICPTCGGPLTYIPQYQRWYCYKDGKYV